jgi:hypothetical protein
MRAAPHHLRVSHACTDALLLCSCCTCTLQATRQLHLGARTHTQAREASPGPALEGLVQGVQGNWHGLAESAVLCTGS